MPQPDDRDRSPAFLRRCLENIDTQLEDLADKRWLIQEELWAAGLDASIQHAPRAKGSIIKWFGGKGNMIAKILPVLQAWRHKRYVEPFGGGASFLLNKRPVEVEVYNDLDNGLVNLFRVIANPETFRQFHRRVVFLPYARSLYNDALATWKDEPDNVLRAVKWYIVARMSFSGFFGASWGSVTTASTRCRAMTVSNWQTTLSRLPAFHRRLARVQIEQQDWRVILDRYDSTETLFYLDPPYPETTRKEKRYKHELTDQNHADIVTTLLAIKGNAVISTYPGTHYDALADAGWLRKQWQTACYSAARTRGTGMKGKGAVLDKQPRIEVTYISPKVAQAYNRQPDLLGLFDLNPNE